MTRRPQHASLIAVIVIVFFAPTAAAQPSPCSEILKWGIYDTEDTLSDEQAFNLAKRVHCGTSARSSAAGGSIGYGLFSFGASSGQSESESFCNSTYEEARRNHLFVQATRRVSTAVTQAWAGCIQANRAGLSHYVRRTPQPDTFSYRIQYTPDGEPSTTTVQKVVMTNVVSCDPALSDNFAVGSGGRTFICRRDPSKAVTVAVNASSGTANTDVIHLDAFVPPVKLPRSCDEARAMGAKSLNGGTGTGWYELRPYTATAIVYCDMNEKGGGWARVGEHLANCGTGDNATTAPLNLIGIPFSEILVRHRSGKTWCSGEGTATGWGCAYNFAIRDVTRGEYLYDARGDHTKNQCRACSYTEWRYSILPGDRVFTIVDPENFENVSEADNGCSDGGIKFDVYIR